MSAVQKAVLDEALKLSHLFRKNACIKHGIPIDFDVTEVEDEPAPTIPLPEVKRERESVTETTRESEANKTTTVEQAPAPKPEPSVPPQAEKPSDWKRLAAVAGLTALAAGGSTAYVVATRHSEPPAVVQPAEPAPTGHLLKWLADEGYNVTPAGVQP